MFILFCDDICRYFSFYFRFVGKDLKRNLNLYSKSTPFATWVLMEDVLFHSFLSYQMGTIHYIYIYTHTHDMYLLSKKEDFILTDFV